MKKLLFATALATLATAPAAPALAQMAPGGGGSHAFDWMLGTWSCKNSVPGVLAGPATQTLTATRSSTASGAIVWRYTGQDYDQYGFLSYVPKTSTWWTAWSLPGGSVATESTKDSGKVTHWTGMLFDAGTGKHGHLRDTYTMVSATKFTDVSWDDSTGTMKIGYNGTCTKQ